MGAQFKSKQDNAGIDWSFSVEGATGSDPAYASFNHSSGPEVQIVPKDQGARSKLIFRNDAGSFIRFKSVTGDASLAEIGCKSGTIDNRPAYFTSFGRRHIAIDPGATKQVFIKDVNEGTNAGNPEAFLHVEGNNPSLPTALLKLPDNQTANAFEIKDATGNIIAAIDKDGNLTVKTVTETN